MKNLIKLSLFAILMFLKCNLNEIPEISDVPFSSMRYCLGLNCKDYRNDLGTIHEKRSGEKYAKILIPVPENPVSNSFIFVPNPMEIFELYADGKLIYHTGDVEHAKGAEFMGVEWHLIELPGYIKNNFIELKFYSDNRFLIGPIADSVKIGFRESIIDWIIMKDLNQIIISIIFLFISISSLFMWVMDKKIILAYYSLLNFSFFVYFFNLTDIKQLYYHHPALSLLLWDFSISAVAVLVNIIFSNLFKPLKIYLYFNVLFVIFNAVKFSVIGINSFNTWTFIQNLMIVGGMFSLLFSGFYVYIRDKNKHALFYGIIVGTATSIGAYEAFINNMQHSMKTNMHYIFLLMSMFIGFIALAYYVRIEKLYSELSFKNEIESKILSEVMHANVKSRINPHFLFNTLNIIHAYMNTKPGLARLAMENIAEYYRYLTDFTSEDLVSLEEEWKFTRNFLNLNELKHENKFAYKFKNNGDLKNVFVPPLIIQPVVENSIVHGLRCVKRKGIVNVTISVKDARVEIEVMDNGKGLDQGFAGSRTIENIRRRLEYYYGNTDVSIRNNKNGKAGVVVLIAFDAVKKS